MRLAFGHSLADVSALDAVSSAFANAPFYAPLNGTLVLAKGTGNPTFARASTKVYQDPERLVTIPAAAPAFNGWRSVRNLSKTTSEDISNAIWLKSGTATVTGTNVLNLPAVNDDVHQSSLPLISVGGTVLFALDLSGTGTVSIRIRDAGGAFAYLTTQQITLTAQPKRYSISATISVASTAATWYITRLAGDTATSVTVGRIQPEDVTGQTNQNPSEYVSVGVLSAPFHGAGIDGFKYFGTANGNTVSSEVVTEATGAVLTNLGGYFAEPAATQLLATADIRDMTTAGWALGATMTRARTSVGADGVANTATRLTGGAVAATNTCYVTVTAAASSRTYSAWVKRVTGTGPVRIVQTGTETNISSLINSTTYTKVSLTASVLDSAMGFKIDTNLDAIDVDMNQFEAGAQPTSPMLTTGAARVSDQLQYTFAGNALAAKGTCYIEASVAWVTSDAIQRTLIGFSASGASDVLYINSAISTYILTSDGTSFLTKIGLSDLRTGYRKRIASWGALGLRVTGDGLAPATSVFDGGMASATIQIAGQNGGINGSIRNIYIWMDQKSDATIMAITA
jgi:hypothetical protein